MLLMSWQRYLQPALVIALTYLVLGEFLPRSGDCSGASELLREHLGLELLGDARRLKAMVSANARTVPICCRAERHQNASIRPLCFSFSGLLVSYTTLADALPN